MEDVSRTIKMAWGQEKSNKNLDKVRCVIL